MAPARAEKRIPAVRVAASRREAPKCNFLPLLTLMTGASQVIELRLRLMAQGKASPDEMLLMVTEKMDALQHAALTMVGGGGVAAVVDNCCKVVAANLKRLTE